VQCGDTKNSLSARSSLAAQTLNPERAIFLLETQYLQWRHILKDNNTGLLSHRLNGTRLNPAVSRSMAENAGTSGTESIVKLALATMN